MKFILNNMIQISNKILGLNKKNFQGSLRKIFPNFNSVMLLHMPLPLSKIFQFSLPSFLPLHLFRTITYYHNIWQAFVDIPKFIIFGATFQNAIFLTWKSLCSFLFSCVKRSLIPGIIPIIIYISSLVHYLVIYWPGTTIFLFFVTDKFIFVDVHIFLHVLKISKSHQNLVFTKICWTKFTVLLRVSRYYSYTTIPAY